jgi:SiaC family regulatory phosphoprotein
MTNFNPTINIDEIENCITISGNSLSENPIIHYQPIFDYLNNIKNNGTAKHIHVKIDVELFASSSLKTLVEVFAVLKDLESENITHDIDWLFNDTEDDNYEKGEIVSSIVAVNINFKMK